MKVIYFANIRSILKKDEEEIFLKKPISISELIKLLKKRNKSYQEAFKDKKNIKCSVNCEVFKFDKVVTNEDEIAFFPPVSGG